MRTRSIVLGGLAVLATMVAAPALAQQRYVDVYPGQTYTPRAQDTSVAVATPARTPEAPGETEIFQTNRYGAVDGEAWVSNTREVARRGAGGQVDRVSVRQSGRMIRPSGAPHVPGVGEAVDADFVDVRFRREWPTTVARSPDGLELSVTPHAGVGAGSNGPAAEAGATVRLGRDLDRIAPDGARTFGERARWYLYAAGSGQAVGYNWARDRDGEYSRAGVSRDRGAFLGDASIGVAMRRGAMHGSVGLVYREIEAEGMRGGHGIDTDVSEGLLAFQLSIRPQ